MRHLWLQVVCVSVFVSLSPCRNFCLAVLSRCVLSTQRFIYECVDMEMDLSQSSIGFETQQECRLKTVNFQHIAACISYIMETVEVCATESAMKKLER